MAAGIKYCILLYNSFTKRLEHAIEAKSGEGLHIAIVKNQAYEWYAYSYNSSEYLPQLDSTSLTIETAVDMPLLFAKGNIIVSTNSIKDLTINFQHQLTQVQVEVDVRGTFGKISSLQAEFHGEYIKKGTFNLRSASFTGQLEAIDVGRLNFKEVATNGGNKQQASYFSADRNLKSFTVKFSELGLSLLNGEQVSLAKSFPNAGLASFENFSSNNQGKVLQGTLDMLKVFHRKKILHIEGGNNYSNSGYNSRKAAGAFLRNPKNFSENSLFFE